LRHHHAPGRQRRSGRRGVRMALGAVRGLGLRSWSRRYGIGKCGWRQRHNRSFRNGRRSGCNRLWNWRSRDDLLGHNGRFNRRWRRNGHHRFLRCNRRRDDRLHQHGRFGSRRLNLAGSGSGGRLHQHGNSERRNRDGRSRSNRWSLGHHGAQRRTRGYGRSGRWRGDDGRSGARQGNDPARLRTGRRCRRRLRDKNPGRRLRCCRRRRRNHRPLWQMALACFGLLLLLLGQDGLQHVSGFGDMREINLGRNALRSARRLRA